MLPFVTPRHRPPTHIAPHAEPISGVWSQKTFSHAGRYYRTEATVLEPKPLRTRRPPVYAGGESEAAKNLIAAKCDAYMMHGDSPERVAAKIADMRERMPRATRTTSNGCRARNSNGRCPSRSIRCRIAVCVPD